jgi:hypothetical protein
LERGWGEREKRSYSTISLSPPPFPHKKVALVSFFIINFSLSLFSKKDREREREIDENI